MKKLIIILFMLCTPLFAACIKGNCENGWGTFVWDNEDQYEGVWQDGKPLWRNQGWGTTSGGQKAIDFGYDKIDKYINSFSDEPTALWLKTDVYNEEKYVSSNRSGKFVNLSDEGFVKYTEQHNLTYKNPKDNIPGRFLFDQEDVTDDYQMHAIYVLASDSKDKQFDLKGYIKKIVLRANRYMKIKTKEKQFRLDLTKEGKLDVSFLRVPLTKKELNQHKDGTVYLAATAVRNGFYHPKKIYMLLYQDKYKDQSGQLGDAILKTPTGNVEIQMGVTYLGHSDANNKPHLHETFHALGFTQLCAPGYAKTGPPRWDGRQDHLNFSNDIMSDRDSGNRNIDRKRKHYYGHSNKDCPLDLRKSVFLEPTEKDPQLPPRTKTCRVARWVKNYNHQRSLDCMAKLDF